MADDPGYVKKRKARAPPRVFTPREAQQIEQMRIDGQTIEGIAKRFKVAPCTIRRLLIRLAALAEAE